MAEQVVDSLVVELRTRITALEQGLSSAITSIQTFARKAKTVSEGEAQAIAAAAQEAANKAAAAAERASERRVAAEKKAAQAAAEAARTGTAEAQATAQKRQEAAEKAVRAEQRAQERAAAAAAESARAQQQYTKAVQRTAEEAAQKKAQEEEAAAQRITAANAAMAAAAAVAFAKIVSALKGAIDAANQYTSAITGLQALAEGTGQDFGELTDALDSLTADGLLPVADAAAALKNLLARGFSAQESITLLERLKDAAAFGRQGSLSLGEAVRSATEGLKNENSVLVDNAGVTKNVSVMWAEYAAEIGKGVNSLTAAEKRQAEYNGILEETKFQVGDAAKYADTFAGSQAALAASVTRVKTAFGSAISDALQPFVDALAPILDGLAEFAEQNPELAAGIVTATAAVTGIVAAFGAWQTATKLLGDGLTSLGGKLGIISAVAGLVAGLIAAFAAAQKSVEDLVEASKELNSELAALSRNAASARQAFEVLGDATAATEDLIEAKNSLAEIFPELVLGYDAEGNAILASNERIRERIALLEEERRLSAQAAQEAAAQAATAAAEEQARLERQKEMLELQRQQYQDALDRGQTMSYSNTGTIDYAKELREVEEELLETERALAENAANAALAREQQYAAVIGQLGDLTEAQELLVEKTKEWAEESEAPVAVFTAALVTALSDTEALAAAQEELAEKQAAGAEDAAEAYDSLADAIKDADGQKIVEENLDVLSDWRSSVEETEKAAEALGKTVGMTAEDVTENLDWIRAYAEGDEQAFYDLLAAELQALGIQPDPSGITGCIQQIITAAQNGQTEAADLLALLQQLGMVRTKTVAGVEIPVPSTSGITSGFGGGTSRGGGSSAKKQTWWEKELAELEHLEAMGEDVADKQIAAYENILAKAKLTTEERWKLEEELYKLQSDMTDAWFEERLGLYQSIADLDEEEAAQRKKALEELLKNENLTAGERARIEQELNELKLALDGDYLEDYIEHLEDLLAEEELNAEQREEIYKELADARIALMTRAQEAEEAALEQTQELAETVVAALKARYTEARDAALDAIEQQKQAAQEAAQARIEAIKAERDAQIDAIDDQIKALDDLLKAKEQQEEAESDQDELNRLKAALAYERDDYNRAQLEQQIAAKEEEIARKKWEADIEAQKTALEEKKDLITAESEAKIEAIQADLERQEAYFERQKEMTQAFYEERLTDYALFNEAIRLMTDEEQTELMELLRGYWTENVSIADMLGTQLYSTFQSKFDSITAAAQSMASAVQAAIASALAAAASASSQLALGGAGSSAGTGGGPEVVEVKVYNQPGVESRVETYKNGQKDAAQLARTISR